MDRRVKNWICKKVTFRAWNIIFGVFGYFSNTFSVTRTKTIFNSCFGDFYAYMVLFIFVVGVPFFWKKASVGRISVALSAVWHIVAFARLASFFLLLSQKKETKEKATPLPLPSFGLSAASGRLRNSCFQHSNSPRRLSICWLKPKARQRGFRVKNKKTNPSPNPNQSIRIQRLLTLH